MMYYQNSSEIQGDGLQTLYLMNPNNYAAAAYSSDAQHNMQFFNSAALIPHAPPAHPHFPLQPDIPAHHGIWGSDNQSPITAQQQQTPRGLSLSLSANGHQSSISGGVISPKHRSSPSIVGSKYLKIAQELLDEVVNVGSYHRRDKAKPIKDHPTAANTEKPQTDDTAAAAADLTTAQRQEIQMKKVKLSNMLDEVEQRCREYEQQMQMLIGAFEQAAGMGSARSYTQLALKTISKQFRCLKSTISAQIKGLNKRLGEEDRCSFEGWRLKFVDHQQRSMHMQQLGMMQSNAAWRPQRGLPERAVSVLRAWLFQHFLHPYPKDSDKQMLAKQTGLTRSQVSNWFINARVRLWKPMVEEMYLEETKNQQHVQIKPETEPEPDNKTPRPPVAESSASPRGTSLPARTNFAQLITSLNMENLLERNPKKPRNAVDLSPGAGGRDDPQTNERLISTENYLSMAAANIDRYGIGEIDQQLAAGFGHGSNGFSLSLGLPPTETFLSHRSFQIEQEGSRINEAAGFEMLDFQNRKPFPTQLLPDFVT